MCNTCVHIINGYVSGNADAFLFLISLLLNVVDGNKSNPAKVSFSPRVFFLVVKGKCNLYFQDKNVLEQDWPVVDPHFRMDLKLQVS